MKIVYLNPVGALGGAERSLLDMMASVRQAMPSADLSLIVGTPGLLIEEAQKIGVRVVPLLMPPDLVELGDSRWRDGPLQFAIAFLYSARRPSDLRLSPKAEEHFHGLAAGPGAFQWHQVSLAGAVGGPSKLAGHLAHSRFLKLASVSGTIPALGDHAVTFNRFIVSCSPYATSAKR